MRQAVLRVSAVLAIALVAGCGKWYDQDAASATSPSVLGALKLSPATASIPANGFSTVLITATVSADATLANRTVRFTTTSGTFVGSGNPETGTIERTVDSQSTATVELRSSKTVETA